MTEELSAWQRTEVFLRANWIWLTALIAFLLAPTAYVLFASDRPSLALFTTSLLTIAFFSLVTHLVWPFEPKVTWQRRLEVIGYRIGVALIVYAALGYGLLWLLSGLTGHIVPVDPPAMAIRRVPFWPFYALAVAGCGTPLPLPPDMPC